MPGVVARDAPRPRHVPASTYRLQVHGAFPLSAVRDLVDYLDRLGVGALYTSPLSSSRQGSRHGYDVTDPTRIDPEIGGEAALVELAAELRPRGMGLLVDIVPNHMAASPENPWWRDVLRHGRASRWAHFFDIDWDSARVGRGRVLLPVLGDLYGNELAAGALRLIDGDDGPELAYHDLRLPLAPGTVAEGGFGEIVDPQAVDRVVAAQHYRPVELQSRRSGQPPPGRLGAPAPPARRARGRRARREDGTPRRARPGMARREDQAVDHLEGAAGAAPRPRSLPPRRLPAAARRGSARRARRRLRPSAWAALAGRRGTALAERRRRGGNSTAR